MPRICSTGCRRSITASPGLAGAILTSEQVAAEVICDGVHVHRDMVRMAIAAKGTSRMMAITDGVAAAGLPGGRDRVTRRPRDSGQQLGRVSRRRHARRQRRDHGSRLSVSGPRRRSFTQRRRATVLDDAGRGAEAEGSGRHRKGRDRRSRRAGSQLSTSSRPTSPAGWFIAHRGIAAITRAEIRFRHPLM